MNVISSLTNLHTLHLDYMVLNEDLTLAKFSWLVGLSNLVFNDCKSLTIEEFRNFQPCLLLKSLTFKGCLHITSDALESVRQNNQSMNIRISTTEDKHQAELERDFWEISPGHEPIFEFTNV